MESQRVNCRRRNLPAELKVEIVDCLPLENAVHFLANVPNRLIIHHCAPRVRRIQIADDYAGRLPDPDSHGRISRKNWHNYTPKMDIFLRYGAAHCEYFTIRRGTRGGFVRYPADFFNDLIKVEYFDSSHFLIFFQHYYETKVPDKAVRHLDFELPLTNRAPWPAALVKPRAGEMKVEVSKVDNVGKFVRYILRNKHNPGIAFKLYIYFQRDAKCYQQMTRFFMVMARVQSRDGAQLCVFGAQAGNILDSMSGDTN